ncbi:hypothetical protein MMC13_007944 [Lambiella insularis]|nr:hypothetical protein [Lambiella insularis]
MASKGSAKNLSWNRMRRDRGVPRAEKGEPLHGTDMDKSLPQHRVPLAMQQAVLDVFKDAFHQRFDGTLASSIQRIKGHLFHRDFSRAFGQEDSLEAYAVRWSPSRALAYMDLICTTPQLFDLFRGAQHETAMQDISVPGTRVTCLGGGAGAEIVALAGSIHFLCAPDFNAPSTTVDSGSRPARLAIKVIDIANWSSVVEQLDRGVTTIPPGPEFSSLQGALTPNVPLVEHDLFSLTFEQQDILGWEVQSFAQALQGSALVTLTFTLNELYKTSTSKTTNFLLTLTYLTEPGTLLLVVDSPGSYSTVRVGPASSATTEPSEKRYPMQWLLAHTLLETSNLGRSKNAIHQPRWEKVASDESTWFRRSDQLDYPIALEDMRFQYHLYRRI